jgi:hypothetical protein
MKWAARVRTEDKPMDVSDDKFRVFISWVDITAGTDWRRVVRDSLNSSHMLLLLFTAPSKNWDWCLFETGLFTRLDRTEIRAVVCLFDPFQAPPSPLADLQGVPAKAEKIGPFLDNLCRKTWTVSDDWRGGALAPDIKAEKVREVAEAIEKEFRRSGSTLAYHPCDRVVLSSDRDPIAKGIPESARAVARHLRLHHGVVRPGRWVRQANVGRSAQGRQRNRGAVASRAR